MPYLFTSPETNGHGSFRAAVGAVLAELDPRVHYFYRGRDMLAVELASQLWELVALHDLSGEAPEPVTFARSNAPSSADEFSIIKRDDAKVYIVTDESVTEAGAADSPDLAVEWPEDTDIRRDDPANSALLVDA